MKFMMLVCYDATLFGTDEDKDDSPTEPEASAAPAPAESAPSDGDDPTAWLDEMTERGVRLDGDRLEAPSAATTVRVRKGEVLLSDGPFAETKEVIAGYDILECADLDEAVEIASKHPVARWGMIELRPFWQE